MTDAEFLTMREALAVPAQWMADALGVSLRSVQFWEVGRSAVPDRAGELLANIDAAIEKTADALLDQARRSGADSFALVRYRNDADLAANYPALAEYPNKVQGVMLARVARALAGEGIQPRIQYEGHLE